MALLSPTCIFILCSMLNALSCILFALCSMLFFLKSYDLFSMPESLCSMLHTLCSRFSMLYAICMLYTVLPILQILYSKLYSLCLMQNFRCPIIFSLCFAPSSLSLLYHLWFWLYIFWPMILTPRSALKSVVYVKHHTKLIV